MSNELSRAAGILVFVVGLVSSVISILVAPPNMQLASFGVLVATSLILGTFLILRPFLKQQRANSGLPKIKDLQMEAVSYVVESADIRDIEWIAQLEKDVYSEEDAIPEQVLKEWYAVNPTGFFIIRIKNGPRIGHLDILPLKPRTMQQFIDGNITEHDIRGDSLYTPQEKEQVTDLYVESIIIRPPKGSSSINAILCLLANFTVIAKSVSDVNRLQHIYAIAASKSGEKLMGHLGFEVCVPADARRDKHPLFIAESSVVAGRVARLCDDRIQDKSVLNQMLRRAATEGL